MPGQLYSATGLRGPYNKVNALSDKPTARDFYTVTERERLLCRLWDLDISGMGDNFMGATLSDALNAWVNAPRSFLQPC